MLLEIIALIVIGGVLLAFMSFLVFGEIRDAQASAWFLLVYAVAITWIDPPGWWSLLVGLGAIGLVETVRYLIVKRER